MLEQLRELADEVEQLQKRRDRYASKGDGRVEVSAASYNRLGVLRDEQTEVDTPQRITFAAYCRMVDAHLAAVEKLLGLDKLTRRLAGEPPAQVPDE